MTLIKKMKMIDLRDFGLPENPQSREEQLCVNYGCDWLGLWNEIFLDYGYVETMTFFYILSLVSKWAH